VQRKRTTASLDGATDCKIPRILRGGSHSAARLVERSGKLEPRLCEAGPKKTISKSPRGGDLALLKDERLRTLHRVNEVDWLPAKPSASLSSKHKLPSSLRRANADRQT
jgi:hypothetical protein